MSIKLSELLEEGASLLSLESENFRECGADDFAQENADDAKALRAIAPALVEFLGAHEHWRLIDDLDRASDEYVARSIFYLDAWSKLEDAMQAAGVRCE